MTEPSSKCPEWAASIIKSAKERVGAGWTYLSDEEREALALTYFVGLFDEQLGTTSAARFQANYGLVRHLLALELRRTRRGN